MKPDLTAFRARKCTYRCGECKYLKTDKWAAHQAHYEKHVESR